jgi:hypothetical protein
MSAQRLYASIASIDVALILDTSALIQARHTSDGAHVRSIDASTHHAITVDGVIQSVVPEGS